MAVDAGILEIELNQGVYRGQKSPWGPGAKQLVVSLGESKAKEAKTMRQITVQI